MKSINFTDEELEHLRSYYYIELVEAEKDVERIKTILSKIGESKPEKPEIIKEKKPRGRKPKVKTEEVVPAEVVLKKVRKPKEVKVKLAKPEKTKTDSVIAPIPVKKTRKPRSDKGGVRIKPLKVVAKLDVGTHPEPILPILNEEIMTVPIAKPTLTKSKTISKDGFKKKKSRPKRPRIFLKNLSKPLPPIKKDDVESLPKEEILPEQVD